MLPKEIVSKLVDNRSVFVLDMDNFEALNEIESQMASKDRLELIEEKATQCIVRDSEAMKGYTKFTLCAGGPPGRYSLRAKKPFNILEVKNGLLSIYADDRPFADNISKLEIKTEYVKDIHVKGMYLNIVTEVGNVVLELPATSFFEK